MLVSGDELEDQFEGELRTPYSGLLTLDDVLKFRGDLAVDDRGAIIGAESTAHQHDGDWKFSNASYRVTFNEEINLSEGHVAMIMPLDTVSRTGIGVYPRLVGEGDELWALADSASGVEVADSSPFAVIVIARLYNVTDSLNDVERRLEEVEQELNRDNEQETEEGGDSST